MHAACALPSELSALCVAFLQRFCYQQLAASCFLFALFFTLLSFIFNRLQPLCPKQGGGGTPPNSGTAISACWLQSGLSSVDSPVDPTSLSGGGAMISKPTSLDKPPLAASRLCVRSSNLNGPKWSIISAPVWAARLRGRSV